MPGDGHEVPSASQVQACEMHEPTQQSDLLLHSPPGEEQPQFPVPPLHRPEQQSEPSRQDMLVWSAWQPHLSNELQTPLEQSVL